MSATGGRPTAALVWPVGAISGVVPCTPWRTACSTGVIDWVVATQLTTMLSRLTPAAAAAASCEDTSTRTGSSAQAVAVGISGSVVAPPTHSGEVRLARK